MKRLILLLICALFMAGNAFGQGQGPSTKNKKAIKYYSDAYNLFTLNNYNDALPLVQKAIDEDSLFIEAHLLLAYIYSAKDKDDLAIIQFKKALAVNPEFYPGIYFSVASLDIMRSNYDEALKYLTKFQTYNTQDPKMRTETPFMIADCKFAANAIKHPVSFNPQNMGTSINTELPEYFPSITTDGETFLFTRRMNDPEMQDGFQEDLYITYKVNGQWTKAVSVGYPLNTPHFNEGAPTLSADGKLLIYVSEQPGGFGSCDLYFSQKQGNNWTKGRNLGRPVNSINWESQPCLSTDGKTLYFIRGDKHDDPMTQDIFMTQLSDSGYWSVPQRLSDSINTAGREECPFIAADNQTLYFCSDGWPGMGGMDIFMSRRKADGTWGTPKNLGYPINSPKDETGIIINPDGQLAYFSSDRDGGNGKLDIYSFPLNDDIKPTPVTYTKGKVYDAKTKQPLMAAFNLIDLETGKVMVQSYSSASDGSFLVCIPLKKNYALNASAKGYLFYSDNFTLKDSTSSLVHPYIINVPLQPIDTGAHIVLKNVFFATDKFNLETQSQVELNKLVAFLNANPTVKIEISGHTDNQGTPQSNIILSKNRAKTVFDYLVAHSITADRLTYKGYGQTRPIATNDTPEGRAQNRRTEMRITGK